MRKAVIALVLQLSVFHGKAQRPLDSLQHALDLARHDSTRVDLLLEMAGALMTTSPERAKGACVQALFHAQRSGRPDDVGEVEGWLGYLEEQLGHVPEAMAHYRRSYAEAERLDDVNAMATLLNNMAAIHADQGRTDSALSMHRRSLDLRSAEHDSLGIAVSLGNIGYLQAALGQVGEAMENYANALRLYEAKQDAEGIAATLHNMAGVYSDQGDLPQALEFFMRELAINDSLGDTYSMASTEDNIGNVFKRQGDLRRALTHYRRARDLHASSGDPRGMGASLRNMASIELEEGRSAEALLLADSSLALAVESSDKRGIAQATLIRARVLLKNGDRGLALVEARKSMDLARELGYPMLLRDAAQLLEEMYREEGRWKEALAMKDLYIVMRDSLLNDDARRSTIRQQYRYAYEKKEAVLNAEQARRESEAKAVLERERNRRNVFLFSGIGVLGLAIGLYSRLRFVRRSRAAIQQQRDLADGLLLNILPAAVAEELKAKGETEAVQLDLVTVLFTDFKGFTAMSEVVTPHQLVHDLHECFSAFDRISGKYGIEKIKTIGDAYMAAGGLPTPNTTHATDVINAALEMRDFIAEGKARKVAAGLPYFEIRIGVHTGPVVAGIVGVKKFQYDIWGDTVNTASRMESSGEVGQVNISEATYALVKNETGLTFTPRGKVQAKGKGEMEMYFVDRSRLP